MTQKRDIEAIVEQAERLDALARAADLIFNSLSRDIPLYAETAAVRDLLTVLCAETQACVALSAKTLACAALGERGLRHA
jgi:hypothetical protein